MKVSTNMVCSSGSGRDHSDAGAALFLEKCQIFSRRLGQFFQVRDALSSTAPPRHGVVHALNGVVAAGVVAGISAVTLPLIL